ncbi:MAG: shikimate dehydrogenase [Actinomycetia bacterium]|nr:shikimate dehydrogenase [Actinomycetes bacterium]
MIIATQTADYRAELVGVFGHPVAENPTVVMHEAAYAEFGMNWRYLTIEVLPRDLNDAMLGLRAMNMRGINLTIPHKVEVLRYLDRLSEAAELMGAVNTVVNNEGELFGENTDGKGFLRALTQDAGVDPEGTQVVVFGAGGASRAITVELALAGAQEITIVNRSPQRGHTLVDLLNTKTPTSATYSAWDGPFQISDDTDIVINATSIGLFPDIGAEPNLDYSTLTPDMTVCDVIHSPTTPFLRRAHQQGSTTLDGVSMLVYQGAIGFKLWTGRDAPIEIMYEALAKAFGLEPSS